MDSASQFISKADIIEFGQRGIDTMLHMGLYDGQGNIIHVTGDVASPSSVTLNSVQAVVGLVNAYVRKEPLPVAATGRKFYKRNLLENVYHPFDADEVIRRASMYIDQAVQYTLFGNNCEHFVNWCRYGVARSMQGETAEAITGTVVAALGTLGTAGETITGGVALEGTLVAVGATAGTLGVGATFGAGAASLTGAASYARSNPRVVRGSLNTL